MPSLTLRVTSLRRSAFPFKAFFPSALRTFFIGPFAALHRELSGSLGSRKVAESRQIAAGAGRWATARPRHRSAFAIAGLQALPCYLPCDATISARTLEIRFPTPETTLGETP